jgi:hypothetical protein
MWLCHSKLLDKCYCQPCFQMDLVDLSAHTKKIKIIEMSQIFIIQKLVLQE